MHEVLSIILRQFIGRLWWDELPERINERGILLTSLSFLGSTCLLGVAIGGLIGLLLNKNPAETADFALNGCFALGCVTLFVIAVTAFIGPDRLS